MKETSLNNQTFDVGSLGQKAHEDSRGEEKAPEQEEEPLPDMLSNQPSPKPTWSSTNDFTSSTRTRK
jgi:hypothetical protein